MLQSDIDDNNWVLTEMLSRMYDGLHTGPTMILYANNTRYLQIHYKSPLVTLSFVANVSVFKTNVK